jgi:exopolysaccharide biosynthesis polyprenyl glycosylphosphotransferase
MQTARYPIGMPDPNDDGGLPRGVRPTPARSGVTALPLPLGTRAALRGIGAVVRRAAALPVRRKAAEPILPLGTAISGVDLVALGGASLLVRWPAPLTIGYALIAFLILGGKGTRSGRINPRISDDMGFLLGRLAIPLLVLAPLAATNPSNARAMFIGPLAAALVLPGRALTYAVIRTARARGLVAEPVLIVGAGAVGVEVAKTLDEHPEYGLLPVGFLDTFTDVDSPFPVLGRPEQLEHVVREFEVSRLIVAFGATREPEMVKIIRACDELPVEVHLVPRFFELGVAPEGSHTDDIWGIPLVRLRRSALRSAAWRTKRAFDLVMGALLFAAFSPVFAVAAIAVRLSGPGPIFFRQQRIGQRGQVFDVLKFRSMRENDDSDVTWAVDGVDARVTPVGRVLRRTGIDELPQLLNVLRGEMSLVGPRPERPFFVARFGEEVPRYSDRHRVPVGITGWAQVHGLRGDTSIPERVRLDNHYVEHWSLWTDIVIVVRTVKTLFRHGGEEVT